MQRWLQQVDHELRRRRPRHSSEETKARKPLAAAEVVVEEVEGNPGYYTSKFFLRPHYQLEGLTVSLRLVSKLPSGQGRQRRSGFPTASRIACGDRRMQRRPLFHSTER